MEPIPTDEEFADFKDNKLESSWESPHSDDDSGERYDNDESESHSDERSIGDEDAAPSSLKSMNIMMGDDFDEHGDDESFCSRYWCCFLCCTVVGICMFLVLEGALQYRQQAALLYGKDPLYGDYVTEVCQVYSKEALEVIENYMITNNDTTTFCVPEKMQECECKHPYQAQQPTEGVKEWADIATMNLAMVEKYTKHMNADVVLLGDSIVEHFNGLDVGYTGGKWKANKRVMDKVFNKKNGGKVEGVALGVAGDRIQNLLFRLQHGEASPEFHPKVWWVLIGTNDLVDHCNADTIAIGNFRIAEEIRKAHPGAIVVLNSILPRNEVPDDLSQSPYWSIIQEVNLKMECYANTANNVEFFNATELFVYKSKGKAVVNPTLMMDAVHPNAEGARLWAEGIADRVVELKSQKSHRDNKKSHHNGGN